MNLSKTTLIFAALYQSSVGLAVLMTVIFLIFKLCGILMIPWLWVFSPLWIKLAMSIVGFIICVFIELIANLKGREE